VVLPGRLLLVYLIERLFKMARMNHALRNERSKMATVRREQNAYKPTINPATEKQIALMDKLGIKYPTQVTKGEAFKLIQKYGKENNWS
jgi:hypothetical protein